MKCLSIHRDQKEYESDEFNIISSKLIRLEPEPTTYEEDINGIEEKVNISEKETNRIRNTYLVDLSIILVVYINLII